MFLRQIRRPRKKADDLASGIPAVFDIETTNLGADFGIVLCAVVKPMSDNLKPRIFRLDDVKHEVRDEDYHVVCQIKEELERHEIVISYNGIKFDMPFLNTRLMYHNEDTIKELLHIDLVQTARKNFRMYRKSLANVIQLLDIPEKKTQIEQKYWRWAMMGDREAMDYVVEHCIQDVRSLESAAKRMLPLVKFIERGTRF